MRARCLIAAAFLLLLVLPVGQTSAYPAPSSSHDAVPIGFVTAVALDQTGNGWAWAYNAQSAVTDTSYLLRITDGTWRVAATHDTAPAILPLDMFITSMAVSADGTDGWVIGRVMGDATPGPPPSPILWRLRHDTWQAVSGAFPPDLFPDGVTITADGTDGWMTASTDAGTPELLLRLRRGAWTEVAPPSQILYYSVVISPDGRDTWLIGRHGPDSVWAAWRWAGAGWTLVYDQIPTVNPTRLTAADNLGNAWMIGYDPSDMRSRDDVLVHFSDRIRPHQVTPPVSRPSGAPNNFLRLEGLAVDGQGRGWLVGGYRYAPVDTPVLARIDGARLQAVPLAQVGLDPTSGFVPERVAISPDGAHSWVGGEARAGEDLRELREPWSHTAPPFAPPLAGAGRCFAEVPYCLRGVFASYWAQHGGLARFGLPITPELQEQHGDTTYTVQYTERARLEYHPQNPPDSTVQLGLLGNALADARQNQAPFQPANASSRPGSEWFPASRHNVGPPFLAYWQTNGGLPVYGLPRSEAFEEKSAADGKTYLVQYFERARLEYHPEHAGTAFAFQFGLLGVEQYTQTYGYTP